MFRVEVPTVPASDLIREAVAITWALWGDVPPRDGFITTVNPRKVQPVIRRGQPLWGYCFLKAGWAQLPELTKARRLVLWQLPLEQMQQVNPIKPLYESEQIQMAI
jgi:hypothetical protein